MPFNPGVSAFIAFRDSDPTKPTKSGQCIYITRAGDRCKAVCSRSDNAQAIVLRNLIDAAPGETDTFELLRRYILLRCCSFGKHRHRIEDTKLLDPLALQWQNEIYMYNGWTTPTNSPAPSALAHIVPRRPTPELTGSLSVQLPRLANELLDSYKTFIDTALCAEKVVISTRSTPVKGPNTEVSRLQPTPKEARYDLRSREVNSLVDSASTAKLSPVTPPCSEFRARKKSSRSFDPVASKLLAPLKCRDFETGSPYVFERDSSPGYVKIGWTAGPANSRLKNWSKQCGYTPKLIWSGGNIPHAQRVEKLAHNELFNEWRLECVCEGCGISHEEWFEVSRERAVHVLRCWTAFMCAAQPYDALGYLKRPWVEIVQRMNRNGELVTGEKMLACFHASLPKLLRPIALPHSTGSPPSLPDELKSEESPLMANCSPMEYATPRGGTALLKVKRTRADCSSSKVEAQLKTERSVDKALPSQAVTVTQKASNEETALPPRTDVVPATTHGETPRKREMDRNFRLAVLRMAVRQVICDLRSKMPVGPVVWDLVWK